VLRRRWVPPAASRRAIAQNSRAVSCAARRSEALARSVIPAASGHRARDESHRVGAARIRTCGEYVDAPALRWTAARLLGLWDEGGAVHPNEEAHRAIVAAFEADDLATASSYYSDDAVFHINGRSSFAGDHPGFAGFVAVFSKLMGTVDSYRQEVLDVTASDQHSIGLSTSTVQRGDNELTSDLVTVLTWRDGKVVDERIITVDPYSADAFYT